MSANVRLPIPMSSGFITRTLVAGLDRVAGFFRRLPDDPEHLNVGREGEELAYFHLRKNGYVVVARNWRTPRRRGELDIVAWDGPILCFVEVKTRSKRAFVPAEAAVDQEKKRELAGMAKSFLRNHPVGTQYRFDIVSVYLVPGQQPDVVLFKDAFGWRTMNNRGR